MFGFEVKYVAYVWSKGVISSQTIFQYIYDYQLKDTFVKLEIKLNRWKPGIRYTQALELKRMQQKMIIEESFFLLKNIRSKINSATYL